MTKPPMVGMETKKSSQDGFKEPLDLFSFCVVDDADF